MTNLYQSQLNYIFNRPITDPAWYWLDDTIENVFEGSPMEAFIFIETLMKGAKTDLKPYSNDQIGLGLAYIFNNAISNLAHDFKIAPVPFERKLEAVRSLFSLFQDVFNPLCVADTSAFSSEKLSLLNNICYMFWDICSLSVWLEFMNENGETQAKNRNDEANSYYKTIAEVMQRCLSLSNPACVESGLHGLGHLASKHPEIVVPIIDDFLKKGKNRNKKLKEYAVSARTGMIL